MRTQAQSTPVKPTVSDRGPRDLIADYARRMVDLAASTPPAWEPAMHCFTRAAALLVRHRGDVPEAVRIGLKLDNLLTPGRDALLLGSYAAAKGREAKGLARLALTQHLALKAKVAE
jgi:hypothetical protein